MSTKPLALVGEQRQNIGLRLRDPTIQQYSEDSASALNKENCDMFYPASYLTRVWMGSQVSAKLLPSTVRPLSAHVKLTGDCQARCISCDYWKSRWQDGLDTERASIS